MLPTNNQLSYVCWYLCVYARMCISYIYVYLINVHSAVYYTPAAFNVPTAQQIMLNQLFVDLPPPLPVSLLLISIYTW